MGGGRLGMRIGDKWFGFGLVFRSFPLSFVSFVSFLVFPLFFNILRWLITIRCYTREAMGPINTSCWLAGKLQGTDPVRSIWVHPGLPNTFERFKCAQMD